MARDTRTKYPHGINKCSVRNSDVHHLKKAGAHSGRKIVSMAMDADEDNSPNDIKCN